MPTDLVTHIGHAKAFEHGAHRTTGDDAGPRRRGAQGHLARTEAAIAVMVQGAAFLERPRGSSSCVRQPLPW